MNGVCTPFEQAAGMDGDWLTYEQPNAEHDAGGRTSESHTRPLAKDCRPRHAGARTIAGRVVGRRSYTNERANKRVVRTPSVRASDTSFIKVLEEYIATLKEQLAGAEARLEKQAADFAARDAERAADLAAERAKTTKAIEAFSALAERLDALASERERRPWWTRLTGIGRREAS